MKLLHIACMLSMCIVAEQLASNTPELPPTLQLEVSPESRDCNIAECVAKIRITCGQGAASIARINSAECASKACVACCWGIASTLTISTCLLNDASCGICCGKSPWTSTPYDAEVLVCANTCPSYCMPNTRHGLKTFLELKPRFMQ